MNFYSMLLEDAATASSSGSATPVNDKTWLIFVLLGALAIMMILYSFFTRRKQDKAMQEMQSLIKIGAKVKTAGGFVGTIEKIDDAKGFLTINIGTEDSPTYVVIDKAFIYIIENSNTVNNQDSDDGADSNVENKDFSEKLDDETESDSEETSSEESKDNE